MTAEEFRRLALALPDAIESAHAGHPDFRTSGKIFATLGYPTPDCAMVKLTPEQQKMVIAACPALFTPATGAWGKGGSTLLLLQPTPKTTARDVLRMAWTKVRS